jgi:hypothetical protein
LSSGHSSLRVHGVVVVACTRAGGAATVCLITTTLGNNRSASRCPAAHLLLRLGAAVLLHGSSILFACSRVCAHGAFARRRRVVCASHAHQPPNWCRPALLFLCRSKCSVLQGAMLECVGGQAGVTCTTPVRRKQPQLLRFEHAAALTPLVCVSLTL